MNSLRRELERTRREGDFVKEASQKEVEEVRKITQRDDIEKKVKCTHNLLNTVFII